MKDEESKLKIVVGTRGSKLATTQTNWVMEKLKAKYPTVAFEMKIIKTKGDIDQETRLDKIGDKGIFTSALEEELISGGIDIAVHSMKDMPSKLPEGLCFAAIPVREDARDVIILKEGYASIEDLPQGAKIGTGSKRRGYQLQAIRSDLQMVPIRGNVDTRIRKLKEENLDGIILAAAGLKRLGLQDYISYCFPVDILIPAPCQGILAIEVKEDNKLLLDMVQSIEDPISTIQYEAERAFMAEINGGCHIPMGAYCMVEGTHLRVKGLLGDEEGEHLIVKEMSGPIGTQKQVGIELAKMLKKQLEKVQEER